MKATELRIGNLYLYQGEPTQLTEDNLKQILDFGGEYDWEPIPFTDVWAFRLGYDPRKMRLDIGPLFFISKSDRCDGYTLWVECEYGQTCETLVCIEYVHQLQNICVELSGEELSIK